MELKEIEQELRLYDLPMWLRNILLKSIEEYGNKQYNKALSDMKKEFICKCDAGGCDMDEQSFDNLKKH